MSSAGKRTTGKPPTGKPRWISAGVLPWLIGSCALVTACLDPLVEDPGVNAGVQEPPGLPVNTGGAGQAPSATGVPSSGVPGPVDVSPNANPDPGTGTVGQPTTTSPMGATGAPMPTGATGATPPTSTMAPSTATGPTGSTGAPNPVESIEPDGGSSSPTFVDGGASDAGDVRRTP